jgi:hypothetical protein
MALRRGLGSLAIGMSTSTFVAFLSNLIDRVASREVAAAVRRELMSATAATGLRPAVNRLAFTVPPWSSLCTE